MVKVYHGTTPVDNALSMANVGAILSPWYIEIYKSRYWTKKFWESKKDFIQDIMKGLCC